MIEWGSFALVAIASLLGACLLVAFAAVGFRLYEKGKQDQADVAVASRGRLAMAGAVLSFAVCAAAVLFGVYLILPAFN